MAAIYGFRIYVIEAYPNSKKDKDPLDLHCDGSTRDHILELLEDLAAEGTLFFPPSVPPQPGHPPKPTPSMTVSDPTVIRQDLIHVRVSMGELDAHRKAASPSGPDVPLEGHSAETDHHVTFLFPTEQDAPSALLISQTYRRRDPVARLLAMMQRRSMELRNLKQQEEKELRAKIKDEGGSPPPKQAFHKVVFDRRQATDSNYLDEIIEGAKRAKAVFQAHVPSDRGNGERVQKSMSVELHLDEERKLGQRISRRWAGRTRRGEDTTRAQGRDEVAEALYEHDLIRQDEAVPYDSAQISLTGGPAGTATIAVDTMREVFTYPVSNGQPPVVYFYEAVAPRVEAVAAEEGIEVDSIDAAEVGECLDGST